jgi:hypothetical protein
VLSPFAIIIIIIIIIIITTTTTNSDWLGRSVLATEASRETLESSDSYMFLFISDLCWLETGLLTSEELSSMEFIIHCNILLVNSA